MLKTSEVAQRLNITNSQVQDLVDFGYLSVAGTYRSRSNGLSYLFAEQELESLNVPAILAEIKEKKRHRRCISSLPGAWRERQRAVARHDHFLCSIAALPEARLLRAAYYLFHLNHYAKAYEKERESLYALKNRVLACIVRDYPEMVRCVYLIGQDRSKIWLCEDCRQSARAAGYTYLDYVKLGHYCEKCYVQVVEREYYSLVEFSLESDDYRFCFHLPVSVARKWLAGIKELPIRERKHDEVNDAMYFYGRRITRIEEKVIPLAVVVQELETFLTGSEDEVASL